MYADDKFVITKIMFFCLKQIFLKQYEILIIHQRTSKILSDVQFFVAMITTETVYARINNHYNN